MFNVNECDLNVHNCDDSATCTDLPGSFSCACLPGFEGDGFICHDENECAGEENNCSVFATCSNVDGGFECNCKDGFEGDGVTCTDIDECCYGFRLTQILPVFAKSLSQRVH